MLRGGGITDLLSCLSKKKEIILLGSGRETQDVYNFLMKNHIDICSFVSENYSERTHKMFGKEILSFMEVRKRYKNPVFIVQINIVQEDLAEQIIMIT